MTPDDCVRLEARLEESPDDFDAWLDLARSRNEARQAPAALSAANNALTLQPSSLEALYEKGIAELEAGFVEAAVSAFTSILAIQPLHSHVLMSLGSAYYQLRRLEVASVVWEQAVRVAPAPLETLENLAVCYQRLGDFEKVAEVWSRVLALDAQHPLALHHLAALGLRPVPTRSPEEYVVRLFDEFAEEFDRTLNALNYQGPRLLADLIADNAIVPLAHFCVLDAGCGTGLCATFLRPWADQLEGVDLSPKMLAQAKGRGLYDRLHCEEMSCFCARHVAVFHLIVAADSLNYFGDLEGILHALAGSLLPQGRLAFFVEKADIEMATGFRLERHGRYSHQPVYVREQLTASGLRIIAENEATIRSESGHPVTAHFFLAGHNG